MSTKTSIKRIALVAVAALGFGMVSTVAANAAWTAPATPNVYAIDNSTTTYAGRVGQELQIAITASGSAITPAAQTYAVTRFAAALTAQPGTTIYPKLATTATTLLTSFNNASTAISATAPTTSAIGVMSGGSLVSTADQTGPASLLYQSSADATQTTAASASTVGVVSFIPNAVGTYTLVVWNESSTSGIASLTGSESYKTFTINVSAGVSSITLTPVNATSVEDSTYGSLVKITLKDAAGNAAALAPGEAISVTPSGTGLVAYKAAGTTGNPTQVTDSSAGTAYNLSNADFSNGVAYVNITDAAAETVSLVASLSSSSSVTASTSLTFKTRVAAAWTIVPDATTAGWVSTGSAAFAVPQVASVTFTTASGSGAASTSAKAVTITDTSGKVSGKTLGVYDVPVSPLGSITVAATFTATSGQSFKVAYTLASAGTYDNTSEGTYTVAATNVNASAINGLITDTIQPNLSSQRVAPAGTANFIVTVSDQFGNALPNARTVMSWTGRNASTAATQVVGYTDANGQVALSYTDTALSTVTATADTVTFTAYDGTNSSTSTATVNWLATTASTVTLTYPGYLDTVAGTTKTDINAAKGGATGTKATITALVKDANGVIIVGVPVTFSVSGLTGAAVPSSSVTAYTDATGTATGYVYSWAAGKATVKATVGAVSATGDIYFSQQTLTEARTISATANGGTVTATVKDRYGNPIKGVYVYATRTGSGFFGNGSSSSSGTTDINGQVDFVVTGAATVTVALGDSTAASTTYGQSADAAGKVGTSAVTASAAGTTLADETGVGASYAAAGVNSVSVEVAGNSQSSDAIDAANEATDAANAATDAANAAAEAADAATAAAQDAQAAVAALATQVADLISGIKAQLTALSNLIVKIQKKVKA